MHRQAASGVGACVFAAGPTEGCMISTAVLTCAVENDAIARHVAALASETLSALEARLSRGVEEGEPRRHTDVGGLARFVGADDGAGAGRCRRERPAGDRGVCHRRGRAPSARRCLNGAVPSGSPAGCAFQGAQLCWLRVRSPCLDHRGVAPRHPSLAFRRSLPRWSPAGRRWRRHPAERRAQLWPGR